MREDSVKMAKAIALAVNTLAGNMHREAELPGIPVQGYGYIVSADLDEDDDEVQLNLEPSGTWVVRPMEVAPTPETASIYQPKHSQPIG